MSDTDWATKQAETTVSDVFSDWHSSEGVEGMLKRMTEALASTLRDSVRDAVASEEKRWSAFAGPDGEPSPVIGTLARTKDGAIIGRGAHLYEIIDAREGPCVGLGRAEIYSSDDWDESDFGPYYSTMTATKEAMAALAAKESQR